MASSRSGDDIVFTERTRAVLDEPLVNTARVEVVSTRQNTQLLKTAKQQQSACGRRVDTMYKWVIS